MHRFAVVPALLALALVAAVPTGAKTAAAAARSCNVGRGDGFGTTYVRYIHTRHVGCRKAKRVVRAFHRCRKGPRGHCHHRVLHFRCREHRFNVVSFQYDSTVKCRRGAKRVRHGYTQNT